jgi:hypothetical protein
MSTANIKFIQDIYAAFGRGDIAALIAGLTADIDWQTLGSAQDYPTLGQRQGHAAVQEFSAQVATTEEFSEFTPREFHATDDKVFVLGYYAGKIMKTGRRFACDWAHVFTIAGGKVSRFREYTDTAQFVDGYRG